MTGGNAWMVEVARLVAAHSEPLHDPPRRLVQSRGEGDDPIEPELLEAVRERSAAGLRRVTAAPVLARQPPAHLDGRREVRLEARPCQADEANETRAAGDLDCPQAPAFRLDLAPS